MPFDPMSYIAGKNAGGGGGGTSVTVEELNVTENDTYTADAGRAFNPVNVTVPNSYTAGDEGKVVSNGALVAQTAHAEVTQNGTVDTTLNNSVTVNVSGGTTTLNKISEGTWTGTGDDKCWVNVGTRMPQTDFVFIMYVDGGTEFAYNTYYKIANLTVIAPHQMVSYDLSSNGIKYPIYVPGVYTWQVNNEGTIKNVTSSAIAMYKAVRNDTMYNGVPQGDRPAIERTDTGFKVYYFQGNLSYKFVSGMTYHWGLYYFGDNPETDIVEVA